MFGFAKQELYIIAFLIFSLLVGASVKMYRQNSSERVVSTPTGSVEQFSNKVKEIDSLEAATKKGESLKKKEVVAEPTKTKWRNIKVNVNKASVTELQKVPQIGPVLASNIVEYRLKKGDFPKIDDMIHVKGIGKKTLNKIRDYLILK